MQASEYLEQQQFDPSPSDSEINDWEKGAWNFKSELEADKKGLDTLLTEAWLLRKELDELDALDKLIAAEYGLSTEELSGMMSDDLKDESRWAQQGAVEGSLWLANAVVGYNERVTAQAQSYADTWKVIREKSKVVPNYYGTNPDGARELDELDNTLKMLDAITNNDDSSPLNWTTVASLGAEKETIDLVERIKAREGNTYGDPVKLGLERLNVWRLKSGDTPSKDWADVWADQTDSYLGADKKLEDVIKDGKEHAGWLRSKRNTPPPPDDSDDPNPFIPI